MSDVAIQIQEISKRYRIGQGVKPSYRTLRDVLGNAMVRPYHRLFSGTRQPLQGDSNEKSRKGQFFWALKDLSFDVKPGEVIGIIGPNGAGKSTLLKILTRITEPTKGSIDIYGRVSSLLEVGTGFHHELTGRENVYLNGAILGMKKAEIDRNFDEIVAFAEVEKFIDTPVKFYSSGMHVRLAFAVAAHLQPEILLVDEVLAVGDVSFQKKCLNKMEDVGREGRTVFFVSHHMPSITRLCERVILLNNGQLLLDGPAQQVVGDYLNSSLGMSSAREWPDLATAPGNEIVRLSAVRIITPQGEVTDTIDIRQTIGIEIEFMVFKPDYILYPGFSIHNEEGVWLFSSLDTNPAWRRKPRPPGCYLSRAWIPGNLLATGTMVIGPAMRTEEPFIQHFYVREAVAFQVIEKPGEDTARVDSTGKFPGVVRPLLNWETEFHRGKRRS